MIRAVANKRLDLSGEEYSYFKDIKDEMGEDDFRGLFSSNKNGIITSVTPPADRKTPMVILFFLLNVMMNQRIRMLDFKLSDVEEMDNKFKGIISANGLVSRMEYIEEKMGSIEGLIAGFLGDKNEQV
jgi:hypothetical protein